jgi:hypothetical protein
MTAGHQFKVVRRISQPTGGPGAILRKSEAVAGPFTSEEDAKRWIELYRQLGTVLDVEPIHIDKDSEA